MIAKVAAQKNEVDAGLQAQVQPGRKVAFLFGRGDSTVELQGTVFARKEAISGQKGSFTQVKIEVGDLVKFRDAVFANARRSETKARRNATRAARRELAEHTALVLSLRPEARAASAFLRM